MNGKRVINDEILGLACQHFLGRSKDDITQCQSVSPSGQPHLVFGALCIAFLLNIRANGMV